MPHIGCHVSLGSRKDGNLADALKLGHQLGANAIQVFLSSPYNNSACRRVADTEAIEVKKLRSELDMYLVVHGKYIYNFCRSTEWQRKALAAELAEAHKVGSDVVIHQGKNVAEIGLTRAEALKAFAANLGIVLDETSKIGCTNKILLENSCQQGTECGFRLEELAEIYGLFKPEHQERLGFCIDLCHIFVAGTLDVRSAESVNEFFEKFNELIGLDKLSLIHFNDSNIRFDGHNDNHNNLMVGHIGNPSLGGSSAGFRQVVRWCTDGRDIPMILETPGTMVRDEIILIKAWCLCSDGGDSIESQYITRYRLDSSSPTVPRPTIPVAPSAAPAAHAADPEHGHGHGHGHGRKRITIKLKKD